MKFFLLRLLPKNIYSKLLGELSNLAVPPSILHRFIQWYCCVYGVDLSNMVKPMSSVTTFNEFFTRKISPESRPFDATLGGVNSPVDGRVTAFGNIEGEQLIQSKGILYSLKDLVGEKQAGVFKNGYFIALYLSPGDYHRIHSPVDGFIHECGYFSGNLWPVNEIGLNHIGGLFAVNERIVSCFKTDSGEAALVKVGALAAGKIKVNYHLIESNNIKQSFMFPVEPAVNYRKGDELGHFELGSAIILLLEKKNNFIPGKRLCVGEKFLLGQLLGKCQK